MSKIKLLLDVIGDLRSLADSLQAVADAVADNGAAEAEMTTTKEPEKAGRFQESWISCPLFLRVSIKKDGGQSGNLQGIGV